MRKPVTANALAAAGTGRRLKAEGLACRCTTGAPPRSASCRDDSFLVTFVGPGVV